MPGMRSEEEILRAFEGLDKAPGSKQARKPDTTVAQKQRKKAFGESNGWDANPVVKFFKGEETELFTIGALAQALDKEIVTIRLWEKKGYLPASPFRLRKKSLNGQKVSGNRVYTRELIEIVLEEFEKRGLLGVRRIEWNEHKDLPNTIAVRWKESVNKTREP